MVSVTLAERRPRLANTFRQGRSSPSGFRGNLWTVPSCILHNLDNSLDVEYNVRNVICIHRGANTVAEAASETAKRSWDRSQALFSRTFDKVREVIVEGEAAAVFPLDLARVKTVVSAMCRALAYRDFGGGYEGDWRVFCASFGSEQASPEWGSISGYCLQLSVHPRHDSSAARVHLRKGRDGHCLRVPLGLLRHIHCVLMASRHVFRRWRLTRLAADGGR